MATGKAEALRRARIVKQVMLDHGVPEVSIELQDGRPTYGDSWNSLKPYGHTNHHIVSNPTVKSPTPGLSLVKRGRPGLDGPLCNGTAGVDLVYRIVTLGLANHPGLGGPLTLRGPMGNYTIPKDNGRAYLWGTEWEGGYSEAVWDRSYTNKRTGMTMTFREFMGRVNAALAEAMWLINGSGKTPTENMDLAGYTLEHKTWAPTRKIDRLGYSTDSGRVEARKYDDLTKSHKQGGSSTPHVYLPNMVKAARGKQNKPSPGVRRIQKALNQRYDLDLKVDGLWHKQTTKGYKQHQRAQGNSPEFCDGIPGLRDLMSLGREKFTVTT